MTDPSIHYRAVQAQARLTGAYDARSLCHKVLVPFEKDKMEGRLGDSNEPYLNKPARCEAIEKSNPVRAGRDYELLCILYDLLEELQRASQELQRKSFEYAFGLAMKRQPRKITSLPQIDKTTHETIAQIISFVKSSYEGQAPVAVFGAILRFIYPNAKVVIHPANEAGASSKEVGDIDILFSNGVLYAVEVKDKPFSDTDVNHAVGKVRNAGYSKAIFAYGLNCGESECNFSLIDTWAKQGVDLSFSSIKDVIIQFISLSGEKEYSQILQNTLENLYFMRAKDFTIESFVRLFNLQSK